jgi:hypothetical protein
LLLIAERQIVDSWLRVRRRGACIYISTRAACQLAAAILHCAHAFLGRSQSRSQLLPPPFKHHHPHTHRNTTIGSGRSHDGWVPPHHLVPGAEAQRDDGPGERERQAGGVPRPLGQPSLPLPPAGPPAGRRRGCAAPGARPVPALPRRSVVRVGRRVTGRARGRLALGAAQPPAGAGTAAPAGGPVPARGAPARRLPPPRRRARQLPPGAGRARRAPG